MGVVFGPVLRGIDGYRFDTWTASQGVIRGYPYRRIEDAYYALTSTIRAFARDGSAALVACRTLDEFIAETSRGSEMRDAA
jgi:hypothetical protein